MHTRVRGRWIRGAVALLCLLAAQRAPAQGFRFTASSDYHSTARNAPPLFRQIQELRGGAGAFHVSVGDMEGAEPYGAVVRAFGKDCLWYPVVGNHDGGGSRNPVRLETLRQYYRDHLAGKVNPGPTNRVETTYSWDRGGAHFVALNIYGDDKSDFGGDGNVLPFLHEWLEADLKANTKPFVFVFGHEPAYPEGRHVGNSLDKFPDNRDRFWALLERHRVAAYISGHTHRPGAFQPGGGTVWQVNTGGYGLAFLDVTVGEDEAQFRLYAKARPDGKVAADGTNALLKEWTVRSPRDPATAPAVQTATSRPLASALPYAGSHGMPWCVCSGARR